MKTTKDYVDLKLLQNCKISSKSYSNFYNSNGKLMGILEYDAYNNSQFSIKKSSKRHLDIHQYSILSNLFNKNICRIYDKSTHAFFISSYNKKEDYNENNKGLCRS